MKRTPLIPPALRLLALGALGLVLCGAAAAKKSAPPKPAAAPAPPAAAAAKPAPQEAGRPRRVQYINAEPDTGQFLPDSTWLLSVGPRVTRVGDFIERWFGSYPEFRPAPDSLGRVQFLQSLVNKDVMGLTALALDKPLGFEDRIAIREARQRALADAVYQRFVRDSVHVSDTEVRALYEGYKWEQHLRHIQLPDKNAAEVVRRELVSGRLPWSVAVRRYAPLGGATVHDGDLGWVKREKMDRDIANAAFVLNPGEISRPLPDRAGWHLVQSVERRPVSAPVYDIMKVALRDDITAQKAREYTEHVLAYLRLQTGMKYDTANAVFTSRHFRQVMNFDKDDLQTSITVDANLPDFSNADTARVLAKWKDGRFSTGDLLHAYSDIPPLLRPSLTTPEAVIGFVETTVLEPNIADYGAQRGLERDSTVVRAVAIKREQLLVEHLYQDSVGTRVWVSKEERKKFYQDNLNKFFTYPSVDFAAIVRSSKAGADSVEKALRAGKPAREIIAADSAAGFVSGTIQHRLQSEGGPYHKSLFEEMRPGDIQVHGPDRQGDYAILQLLKFDGGRQLSFAESESMADESLQNMKADEALQAMIGRLKKRYAIRSRPELVMRIRLVDPSIAHDF